MEIKKLLQQMTLKEKVGQLNQRLYGWQVYEKTPREIKLTSEFKREVARWGSIGFIYGVFRSDPWSGKDQATGLSKEEAWEVSQKIQQYVQQFTRLKIPVFLSEECPHGHLALDAITTPTNIAVGASWNPSLYGKLQDWVAEELREKGAHLSLISTLDVARDPRWGRCEECFSEDPFLTGQFAMAAVEGLQGTDSGQIAPNKALAVLKHFAAQGSTMGGHNAGPVTIGERELREIHLLPMAYAIEKGAKLCMAAYNDLDGIPCHGNATLLNEILRKEFGFKGAVIADGCALDRLVPLVGSRKKAAAWALKSGVDISLWDEVFPCLEQAVLDGLVDESLLDQSVARVLSLKAEMGLFENPTPLINGRDLKEKNVLNLALATESIVLLKNKDQILPIDKSKIKNIAVIGPNAHQLYNQLGDYTPFKDKNQGITLLKGLKTVLVSHETIIHYEQGTTISEEIPHGITKAVKAAERAEMIIVALGGASTRDFNTQFGTNGAALAGSSEMTCGENIDLANIALPLVQQKLVQALSALGKPVIAVLIQGRPHSLSEIEPLVDGILMAGYPGEQGGLAIAQILVGNESPSGKLAMSIPRSSSQLPVYYNYRHAAFKEDYLDQSGKALYPFGYGLSYSNFSINDVRAHITEDIVITGTIKNTGTIKAAEVIQVYLCRKNGNVIPRIKELKGFTKVWLDPGVEKVFTVRLTAKEIELKGKKEKTEIAVLVEALNFQQTLELTLS